LNSLPRKSTLPAMSSMERALHEVTDAPAGRETGAKALAVAIVASKARADRIIMVNLLMFLKGADISEL
jgi:hypothetical protein